MENFFKKNYNINFNIFLQSHLDKENLEIYKTFLNNIVPDIKDIFIYYDVNDEFNYINKFNRIFNEYCMLYSIWKSKKYKDLDIIGFGHYRRFINPLSSNIQQYINDIIYNNFIHFSDFRCMQYDVNLHKEYRQKYKGHRYEILLHHLKSFYVPDFLIDELIDYLDSYQDQYPLINSIFKNNKYLFIRRSLFICNIDNFENIMMFMDNFYNRIFKKYNLSFNDYDGFVKWYYDNIIKYYQSLDTNKLLELKKYIDKSYFESALAYQNLGRFNEIFNEKTNYGLDTNCNCWRMFGYLTEILIGIYLVISNKAFFTAPSNTHKFIFEDNTSIKLDYNLPFIYNKKLYSSLKL